MTVAITLPAVQRRDEMKVSVTKWKEYHREYRTMAPKNMQRKFIHRLTRKKPNMSLETMRMSVRIVMISEGSATVAPAKSSLKMIWTGLNQ
jgi:hypothetical protein